MATSLYNIVDSIFIGRGVGPMAIAGLAITFPLMNLVVAFYDNLAQLYDIKEEKFSLAIKGTTIEQILSKYFPAPSRFRS